MSRSILSSSASRCSYELANAVMVSSSVGNIQGNKGHRCVPGRADIDSQGPVPIANPPVCIGYLQRLYVGARGYLENRDFLTQVLFCLRIEPALEEGNLQRALIVRTRDSKSIHASNAKRKNDGHGSAAAPVVRLPSDLKMG